MTAQPSDLSAIDDDLMRIASMLIVAGQRLADQGRGGTEDALAAVADLRRELERVERDLVASARRTGRSWAQIGAILNLIATRDHDPELLNQPTPRATHSR